MITHTTARIAALTRQLERLGRMDDARTHPPEATGVTREGFESYWRTKFDAWVAGLTEAEADAEARRWLALQEAAL